MDFWTILVLAVPEHRASLSVLAFFHFCHPGLLGREMSWWVKFLQCKHEDFSSDPTQAKGQEQLHPRVIPAQKSGDQRIMGYLAIHFTPSLGSRFNERLWLNKVENIRGRCPTLISDLQVNNHRHTHLHTHKHTHACIHDICTQTPIK